MAEKDESLFGGLFDTPEEPIRPETVGALDYITDIPIGALKGDFLQGDASGVKPV